MIQPVPVVGVSTLAKLDEQIIQDEEVLCLAKNIYFEARSESTAGKMAVTQTVLNRVRDPRFPNTTCGVVFQGVHRSSGNPVKNLCQFSWYCDGKSDKPSDEDSWRESIQIARFMFFTNGNVPDITDGATYYHADYVTPRWGRYKTKTVKIDRHIFYK